LHCWHPGPSRPLNKEISCDTNFVNNRTTGKTQCLSATDGQAWIQDSMVQDRDQEQDSQPQDPDQDQDSHIREKL